MSKLFRKLVNLQPLHKIKNRKIEINPNQNMCKCSKQDQKTLPMLVIVFFNFKKFSLPHTDAVNVIKMSALVLKLC